MNNVALISRDDAQLRNLKRFYTGEPCPRGHDAERYVSNGGCIACVNRATAKKVTNRGAPLYTPAEPLNFDGPDMLPLPTLREAQAAFRYMAACGWHLAAIKALRADPVLMERYDAPKPTPAQVAEAERQAAILRARSGIR